VTNRPDARAERDFKTVMPAEVWPWNAKFAWDITEQAMAPTPEIAEVTLEEWAAMDEAEWWRRTQGTAIRRAKWEGFRRNVLAAPAMREPSHTKPS
jgi:epoxyqueuosine reductase QueG